MTTAAQDESTTDPTGVGTTSTTSASETTAAADASDSASSGGPIDCADWEPADPQPPSSFRDCATTPCPDGEACRYDPHDACGAPPVCVNTQRLACACVVYGPASAGVSCPCPGYEGPLNELNQAPLECNTRMSDQPVSYDLNCIL